MIKCALISGRGMGLMHGGNFHNHPDAEVVSVCDMDPELLAKAEEQFGAPGYSSIEELLANCDAELVLLIVNETRRIPPLRQLLEAGRNVFTEKPLCGLQGQHRVREPDLGIAAPAIATWRDSNLKFGIDFNYRFMHHFRKLHDDVAEGRLGEIRDGTRPGALQLLVTRYRPNPLDDGHTGMGKHYRGSEARPRLGTPDSYRLGKGDYRIPERYEPMGLR